MQAVTAREMTSVGSSRLPSPSFRLAGRSPPGSNKAIDHARVGEQRGPRVYPHDQGVQEAGTFFRACSYPASNRIEDSRNVIVIAGNHAAHPSQKLNLNPSCTSRGPIAVYEIFPKVSSPIVVSGVPNTG